ncbi:MAG: Uma2 family endonuclease [Geminicoccaceae bacterium]|jgi:Uma2 family endonuclease|nr:Uma2 family endonuclease [Geminicoccaceae bacterium]MCB9968840.1 Uma2 family endonuclease [Geminicoccaceae bacterium]HRY26971.1 Uma2 family endonuclease [Geminicoccaceae bacterium]
MARARPDTDLPRTLDDFRLWHQRQPATWEFIEGMPRMMAPGSLRHTLVKTNLAAALNVALRGRPCLVLADGAIVEVASSSLIPDIVVTCAEVDLAQPRVEEPLVVVEIASPSSERDDLGHELDLYLRHPAVRHYLFVSQEERRLLHHERRADGDGHFLATIRTEGELVLDPPGITISLADIWSNVPLPA